MSFRLLPVLWMLLAASAADPSFTSFLAAVSLADLPLDTGLPQRTLAPLEGAADCGDGEEDEQLRHRVSPRPRGEPVGSF